MIIFFVSESQSQLDMIILGGIHPISVFDAPADSRKFCLLLLGCTTVYYPFKKCCAFWRLVLECFHKQKTTKITLNSSNCAKFIFPMHTASYATGKSTREKPITAKRKVENYFCSLWESNLQPSAYTLSVIPICHHILHGILMLIYCIYIRVHYLILHGQWYSSSRAVSTLIHRGYNTVIQYYNAIRLSAWRIFIFLKGGVEKFQVGCKRHLWASFGRG